MGIGNILSDIPNYGSQTAPSGALSLTVPSPLTDRATGDLPVSTIRVPGTDVVMLADGVSPVRHVLAGVQYRTGLLPPAAAMTATPTGARATATLDTDAGGAYAIANGDYLDLVTLGAYIYFRTTLSGSPLFDEVLINGSTANALTNLKKLINNTGIEGVDYKRISPWENYITAETLTSTDLTFQAKDYGTGGNGYRAHWYGGAGPTLGASDLFSGGSAGSGDAPSAGTRQYSYAHYRKADGAQSAAHATYVEASTGAAMNINLAALADSPDSTVDFQRWFRTVSGGGRLYRAAEIAQSGADTDTDDLEDDDIRAFGAQPYNEREYRSYVGGHVPRHRFLVNHLGKVFGFGASPWADYSAGTASVTADSATATLSTGAVPVEDMEGRYLAVSGDSEEYLIVGVNESTRALTLARPYKGSTNATASYTIHDRRDTTLIHWAESGKPNQWPGKNSLAGVSSLSAEGLTGGASLWESMILFTRDGVWRVTGTGPFAVRPVFGGTGCVAHGSIVEVDGVLFWLAPDGIYAWGGGGAPERISAPRVEGAVRGINGTIDRINQAHAHLSFAVHDADDRVVRWFVPLDDAVLPSHAIVLDLQTTAFSVDPLPGMSAAAAVTLPDGSQEIVLGDGLGCVWHADIGSVDGAFGFEPRQVVQSGATARTFSVSGTPLPTSGAGLRGVPVLLITSAGDFTLAKVASNTSSAVTLWGDLTAAPASGTVAIFGAIDLYPLTGRFSLGITDEEKTIPDLSIVHSPGASGRYFVVAAADQDDLAVPAFGDTYGLLTDADAHAQHAICLSGRLHQFGLHAFGPGDDPAFLRFELTVYARSRVSVPA